MHEIPNKRHKSSKIVDDVVEVEEDNEPRTIYGQVSSPYKDDPIGKHSHNQSL